MKSRRVLTTSPQTPQPSPAGCPPAVPLGTPTREVPPAARPRNPPAPLAAAPGSRHQPPTPLPLLSPAREPRRSPAGADCAEAARRRHLRRGHRGDAPWQRRRAGRAPAGLRLTSGNGGRSGSGSATGAEPEQNRSGLPGAGGAGLAGS